MWPADLIEDSKYADREFDTETLVQIQQQLKRIAQFPTSEGAFTLLHHTGPVIEQSFNVHERVNFILRKKPTKEVLQRLKNIYYVPRDTLRFYNVWARHFYEELLEQEFLRSSHGAIRTSTVANVRETVESRLRSNDKWRCLEKFWLNSIAPTNTWDGDSIFPMERIELMKNRFQYIPPTKADL